MLNTVGDDSVISFELLEHGLKGHILPLAGCAYIWIGAITDKQPLLSLDSLSLGYPLPGHSFRSNNSSTCLLSASSKGTPSLGTVHEEGHEMLSRMISAKLNMPVLVSSSRGLPTEGTTIAVAVNKICQIIRCIPSLFSAASLHN